jgi:hypothetical protein
VLDSHSHGDTSLQNDLVVCTVRVVSIGVERSFAALGSAGFVPGAWMRHARLPPSDMFYTSPCA